MRSRASRSLEPAASALAVAGLVILFGPWFGLWSSLNAEPALLSLYFRAALVAFGGVCFAYALRVMALARSDRAQKAVAICGVAIATPLAAFYVVRPMLGYLHLNEYLVFATLLGLFAWLWGISRARATYLSRSLHRHLAIGAASMACCAFAADSLGAWQSLEPLMLLFMLCWSVVSLASVMMTHFVEIASETGTDDVRLGIWRSVYGGMLISSLAFVVLLTALTPALWAFSSSAWSNIERILSRVGAPFVWLLRLVSYVLAWLYLLLRAALPRWSLSPQGSPPPESITMDFERDALIGEMPELAPWVLVAATAVVVLVLAARYILNYLRVSSVPDSDEVRETLSAPPLWDLRAWLTALSLLWCRLSKWLFGKTIRPHSATQMYHELLRLGARKGKPRPKSVTAIRHMPVMLGLFPWATEQVNRITLRFMDECYGDELLSAERLQQLRVDWEQTRHKPRLK